MSSSVWVTVLGLPTGSSRKIAGTKQREDRGEAAAVMCRQAREVFELPPLCLLPAVEIPDGLEAALVTAGCCVASCKCCLN